MLKTLASHVRGNLVGYIALFVALGGTAMASVIVTSNSQVAQNTISGHKPRSGDHPNIIAGSITGKDIAPGPLPQGATSFATTVPADGNLHTVRTVDGLQVEASCSAGVADLGFNTTPFTTTLQSSGTANGGPGGNQVVPFDTPGGTGGKFSGSDTRVSIDAIARNRAVSTHFTRFDLHVEASNTATCPVWGVITPSA